jgi:beta-mannosidase
VLDRESRRIIRDLRAHPCLAIWCGGNELFNSWSGMTDQHHAIRLLNANCYALDPDTPFLPTSPVMGVGHGCYRFELDDGRDVFQYFRDARHTAYTEFGCPGPADLDVLERIVPTDDRDAIVDGSAWQTRHAIHAWAGREAWLHPQAIERIMGPCATIAELVDAGRLLQREGYVALFEEARRQKPRCSMALNWCYNEPWPTAANNSVIGWPARPKAGYEALRRALRPTQASARIERFQWAAGETFAAELWRLHDGPAPATGGVMRARLELGDRTIELGEWRFDGAAPDTHQQGPVVTATLPELEARTMTLRLEVADQPDWSSEYTLRYRAREP